MVSIEFTRTDKLLERTEMRMLHWVLGVSVKDRNKNENILRAVGVACIDGAGMGLWRGVKRTNSCGTWILPRTSCQPDDDARQIFIYSVNF